MNHYKMFAISVSHSQSDTIHLMEILQKKHKLSRFVRKMVREKQQEILALED